MKKKFLITTADERSWRSDSSVLFLGQWCRRYDRKHIWSSMDSEEAEPYGLEVGQKGRDIAFIQSLSRELLQELTDALNTFHNTRYSLRYWDIVLGHWLQRYVAVAFNRYFTLEKVLKEHDILGTTVFDSTDYSLATNDSLTFVWACNDDVWNHVLYSKVLDYLGGVETELDPEPLRGVFGFFNEEKKQIAQRVGIKHVIRNAANKILPKLSRERDAFIINSYLPRKEEIKLQLSLGQCPQLWQSPALKPVTPVSKNRGCFRIDADNYQGFQKFVRLILGEIIPRCYLEGYSQLVDLAESLPWPAKPKFIFTSNKFDKDEIFKVWVGSMVEKGIPYYAGQHGNNYGTLLGSQNWPELVTCDKFFTWGWTNGNSKNIPAFVFKAAGGKSQCCSSSGGLLLIELHPPHRLGPEDSYFEYDIYQEEQFRFVGGLPDAIQNKLTVRLHCGYKGFRWFDEQRWKDRSPHTHIETGVSDIRELMNQSRLVVHSYDSTGILETLASNIPTICFWHGGLEHLLPNAKPYYELLRNAGILADTPEQAAELITLHWDNVTEWWGSQEVQDARNAFCDQFARTEKAPIRTLRRLLTM